MRRLVLAGVGIALLAGIGVTLATNGGAAGQRTVIAQEVGQTAPPREPAEEPGIRAAEDPPFALVAEPAGASGPVSIAMEPELESLDEPNTAISEVEAAATAAVSADPQAGSLPDPAPDPDPLAVPAPDTVPLLETASPDSAPPVAFPIRLRIPALGVDADVEYVGVTEDGAMDVPKDPRNVAWYELGPRPGEPGNAIIAGHVDWGGRLAVFGGLRTLASGALIRVVADDGAQHEFVVDWLRWYDAETTQVEEVFGQGEATELTLITCGGIFDQRAGQYLSRLVVRSTLRRQ